VVDDLSRLSMPELFRLEADTQTAVLSAGVLAIEDQAPPPEAIESMMRAAHSLKGAARIVGLDPAVLVAHAMEEVFAAAGKGLFTISPDHADVLLEGIDFLGAIAHADTPVAADGPWMDRATRQAAALTAMLTAPAAPAVRSPPPTRPAPAAADPAPSAIGLEATEPPHASDASPLRPIEPENRVVRVSADSLSRLVGLAGESLVETQRLRSFLDGLLALRRAQARLCESLATADGRGPDHRNGVHASPIDDLRTLREEANAVLAGLARQYDEFTEFARRGEMLSSRLHEEVIASRMRPLADGIRGLPRLVRDVARSLGKQARFEVRGEQTGVDRDILDRLEAPLSHLVRNALDHGIEPPALRTAAGKPAVGTILIEARHNAGMLAITVTDDGAGVDAAALRTQAVERGFLTAAMADRLSIDEVLEFLFLPGFSTRDVVTEISGRGVGLDVVQSMARAVGGSVRVTTRLGHETAFTLQLPITTSVIRALLVEIAGDAYAFPLARIDRIITCRRADIHAVEGRHFVEQDGVSIGLVTAAQVLELDPPRPLDEHDAVPVVVIGDHGRRFGVIVGAFLGERDLDIRPLDPRLDRVPDVAAASILEDGSPVLIIDVDDLGHSIEGLLTGRGLRRLEFAARTPGPRPRKRILVVDDSITVRELERQLLQARGFDVDVAVDGMDGWNTLRAGHYDLVVSDVDMPRLDGIGLVSLVRADPLRRQLPIVIVSYKDRQEDRLRGLKAGASRYLTKSSFHDETFLHTIIDLIGEP